MKTNGVMILDFGSQYTKLIARRVRENGVYAIIKSNKLGYKEFLSLDPKGIVLSGGPDSVTSKKIHKVPDYILKSGIPILAICYGMQLISHYLAIRIHQIISRNGNHH